MWVPPSLCPEISHKQVTFASNATAPTAIINIDSGSLPKNKWRRTSKITNATKPSCTQPDKCAALSSFLADCPTTNKAKPYYTAASANISKASAINPVEDAIKPAINSTKSIAAFMPNKAYSTFCCAALLDTGS